MRLHASAICSKLGVRSRRDGDRGARQPGIIGGKLGQLTRARGGTIAFFAAMVLLNGCSAAGGRSSATHAEQGAAPLATTIPIPDLGPSPAAATLDAEQTTAARLADQDERWRRVLLTHPGAARPTDPFVGFEPETSRLKDFRSCLVSHGVPIESGTNQAGEIVTFSATPTTTGEAVAAFSCENQFPPPPEVPLTDLQLGYLYDYLTEFLEPCYSANGIENPPPPSREDFVANWPHQDWYPSLGLVMGTSRETAIIEACPYP
ncbi:hypothetical protein BH09ACT6_BH09ACT6_22570 [soil metagenome]